MQFNQTSSPKAGIIQTCELLLDVGDGAISGNTTLLAQFTNLCNRAFDNIVAQIMENEGDYTWDDYNNTTLPTATLTALVDGQSDYTLPVAGTPGSTDYSSFLRLIQVRVKDAQGNLQKLNPISDGDSQMPLETVFTNSGFPQWYKLVGNSIILYPAPLASQVTLIGGLNLTFQRDKIDFLVSDTTKQPGFPSIYHYLLPLEMSETWAAIKKLGQLQFIQQKRAEFIHNLGWGTANRNKDQRQRIQARASRYNRFNE